MKDKKFKCVASWFLRVTSICFAYRRKKWGKLNLILALKIFHVKMQIDTQLELNFKFSYSFIFISELGVTLLTQVWPARMAGLAWPPAGAGINRCYNLRSRETRAMPLPPPGTVRLTHTHTHTNSHSLSLILILDPSQDRCSQTPNNLFVYNVIHRK